MLLLDLGFHVQFRSVFSDPIILSHLVSGLNSHNDHPAIIGCNYVGLGLTDYDLHITHKTDDLESIPDIDINRSLDSNAIFLYISNGKILLRVSIR